MKKKFLALIAAVVAIVGLSAPPATAQQDYQVATGWSHEILSYNDPGWPTTYLLAYSNAWWKGFQVRGYILCHNVNSATLYWAFSVWKPTSGTQWLIVSCNGGDYIWFGHPGAGAYYNNLWGLQYQ